MKYLINYLINSYKYISAANEGDEVAVAAGAYLGNRKSVVLMQNSGSHAGHLLIWFKEGILGFLIYLSFYLYLGITGFNSFRRTKNKNGLLLLVMIIAVFLQSITWQTILLFPSDIIMYMFLFAGMLYSIQRYSSYEGFNNNILTLQ